MATKGKVSLEELIRNMGLAILKQSEDITALKTAQPAKSTRRRGKAAKVRYELDLGDFMPAGNKLPSDRGMAKVRGWAQSGDVARLRKYAGIDTSEPKRIAVYKPNRLLGVNVVNGAFDSKGKPLAKYLTPITTRQVASEEEEAIPNPEPKAPRKTRSDKGVARK